MALRRRWSTSGRGQRIRGRGPSGYAGRSHGQAWLFAARVAERITAPDPVYVLDVCEADTGLRLLELNPFSGADLYACNGSAIVRHVSQVASGAV